MLRSYGLLLSATLVVAAGWFSPVFAGDMPKPLALSFRDALRIAKTRHVDILVAGERVEQALERIGQAAAPLLPQLQSDASQSRQTQNLRAMGISIPGQTGSVVGPFNTLDARLSLTQTIFDMATIERLRSAHAGKRMSMADALKVEQDVLALVGTLYLEAKRAREAIAVQGVLLRRDQEQLRVARAKLRLGVGDPVRLKELAATVAERRYELARIKANAEERRLDLTSALGFSSDQDIVFVEDKSFEDIPLPDKGVIAPTVGSLPEVRVSQELFRERQAEHRAELAEFFPKVSGFGDYGASGETPAHADDTYRLGLKVTLPLFEGGRTIARVKEASSKVQESKVQWVDTQHRAEAKILSATQSVRENLSLMEAKDAALLASNMRYALARERLRTGMGNRLEVLEALADRMTGKDQKEEAVADYRMAEVNLAHALGQMERLAASEK